MIRKTKNLLLCQQRGSLPVHRNPNAQGGSSGGSYDSALRLSLRKYQITGVNYLRKNNGRGVLIWEMRLGKSITAIRFLAQRQDAKRILVVGPYSVLPGWVEELKREKAAIFDIFKFKPKERTKYFATINSPGWYLINKEAFLYCNFLAYLWDAIIIDETWIANPYAKVTKYFLKNTDAKYRILLSGTPAPENELQYYTQLSWVDPAILNCKSYWDFRIRFFRIEGFDWRITIKGAQRLAAALASRCSVLKRKDVGLEKQKIFERRVINLSPATRKRYAAAESGLLDDKILKFAGQWWNEMRRLCSGKEKEAELLSLIHGELKNEKIMIWADYVEEVERVARLIGCCFIHGTTKQEDRDRRRENFIKTKQRYLVAQPQCWKWGTNLSGVDTVIFFSMPQGLMTWQQVCERTVDLTSNASLLIVSLIAENTIEESIIESLYAKEDRQKQLDRIRRGIESRQPYSGPV